MPEESGPSFHPPNTYVLNERFQYQEAGELGPSCIIGAGSFNLFAITAVCTASVVGALSGKDDVRPHMDYPSLPFTYF